MKSRGNVLYCTDGPYFSGENCGFSKSGNVSLVFALILATGLGRTRPRGRGNVPPPSYASADSLVGVMSPSS